MIFHCFLICILFFTISAGQDVCSLEDLEIIERCYEELSFKNMYSPVSSLQDPELPHRSEGRFKEICEQKNLLDECMNKTIVKQCFSIKNLKRIAFKTNPFIDHFNLGTAKADSSLAYLTILDYFHMDYLCGDIYQNQFALENVNCTKKAVFTACDNKNVGCHELENTAQCYANSVNETCGEKSAAFVKKMSIFLFCHSHSQTDCKICNDLMKDGLANIPDANSSPTPLISSFCFTVFVGSPTFKPKTFEPRHLRRDI